MVIRYGEHNQYHNYNFCPVCNSNNKITKEDTINHDICECETECIKCGHENYWAYGSFVQPFKSNDNLCIHCLGNGVTQPAWLNGEYEDCQHCSLTTGSGKQ